MNENKFTISCDADPSRIARTIKRALAEKARAEREERFVRNVALAVGLAVMVGMFWCGR